MSFTVLYLITFNFQQISLQIPGACNLSMDLPVLIGTVPLRSSNYRHINLVENTNETSGTQMYYQPAPPYSEIDTSILPSERKFLSFFFLINVLCNAFN